MAKRRKGRVQTIKRRKSKQRPVPTSVAASIPSAATLFRFKIADAQTQETIDKAISKRLKPHIWDRDRGDVKQIEQAQTAEALIELAHLSTGLAAPAWHNQARRFGPEIIPIISEQLRTVSGLPDQDTRTTITETLVAELRWRGESGAEVLLERYDNLDHYGRSLACVVLGLLDAQPGADKIWNYYQKVVQNRRETYFVGALWGLIDLKDERGAETLVNLLIKRRYFYELYGFLAWAGDERAIAPLLVETVHLPEEERHAPFMALSGIGHRLGRTTLVAAIDEAVSDVSQAEVEDLADKILSRPLSEVEDFFPIFYKTGMGGNDLEKASLGAGF